MVSILVAIYNKELEISQCIKSLIKQSYKDLEIILVNDGSTDSTKEICEKFLARDNRIKLINKKNEGLEMARRTGLEYATGEYIMFVDGDDWLPKNSVEILLDVIKKEDADVCFGKGKRVIDKYGLIKRQSKQNIYDNVVIDKNEFKEKYYESFCGWGEFPICIWGKLYKKSLLDSCDIKTVGITLGEDLCFNLQVLPKAEKIVSTPKTIYFYRWGGMTNKINEKLFIEACEVYNFKIGVFSKMGMTDCIEKASFELCNFFKSYIEQYLMFYNPNDNHINLIIEKEIQNPDLQRAVNFIQTDWMLKKKEVEYIKEKNIVGILNLQKCNFTKKKIKKKMLIIVSKIFR